MSIWCICRLEEIKYRSLAFPNLGRIAAIEMKLSYPTIISRRIILFCILLLKKIVLNLELYERKSGLLL